MQEYPTLAAIDLGSNSFHLQVGRVDGDQLYYLDAHKESVRLAGGLTEAKMLDGASQNRALACLSRFGERLQGMPPGAVRAVGTSALRVARNAPAFLERAKAALGFDIDIVAGREEARLIYLGVAHSLPLNPEPRLVVDIGGGSTECIIGVGYEPRERESLRMGCVVFSNRFFPGGVLDKAALKAAVTAARMEVQPTAYQFRRERWQEAVGSSGSARAMGEILFQNGLSDGQITADGLKWLRERLAKAGSFSRLELAGLKDDRKPVLAGGVAIMSGLFQELDVATMTVAQGAMREGILWDLLGRVHNHDMRDVTVTQFARRYHVDGKQARRVERLAARLYMQLTEGDPDSDGETIRWLNWAARLHEIGIGIAHSGYHRHGAYILENADMPGFGRRDQARLAALVRASRGGLDKLGYRADDPLWPLILCLRLAVLFNVSRSDTAPPELALSQAGDAGCELALPAAWLAENPLSQVALDHELKAWQTVLPRLRLAQIRRTGA
jgi:exopolyphosphatase/guanosine-5'-triphosphate,3'-diphosphate pyrophosphatase